jgi:hypothetical protein
MGHGRRCVLRAESSSSEKDLCQRDHRPKMRRNDKAASSVMGSVESVR